jgi:hypothetical protein
MRNRKIILGLIIFVFGLGSIVSARNMERETKTIPCDTAKKINLNVSFGVGELTINPSDMKDACKIDLYRDLDYVKETFDFDRTGQTEYVTLESKQRNNRHNFDSERNKWDMTLSTQYEMEASFDIGACDAEIELGGVPLTELSINAGAVSGVLSFDKPNPKRMKEIRIDAGASSLKLLDLGNANFDYLDFDGGAGSFDIDLRGTYKGESEVVIDVGVGSADIFLPSDIPIRIETDDDKWFSSVDIHGRKLHRIDDGVYESTDYDEATTRILLKIDVGMGSVDVRFKP